MKTWILDEPKQISLAEQQPSTLQQDQIKIKIEKILLTNSDYKLYTGETKHKYPFVMGRNAVGYISELGDEEYSPLNKMDRVAIEPFIACGNCYECKNEMIQDCTEMQELGRNTDGFLSNFVDVPAQNVHLLPENLTDEKALFASYVSFCLNVIDRLQIEKGQHVAIFSTTKTGLILAQLVAYYQAMPIFISSDDNLLKLAGKYGIFYNFNADKVDLAEDVKVVTGGRMCKKIAFFSDSEFAMKDVYNVASTNADICLAGYSSKESKLSVAQICQKHLNVFGVYNGAGNFSSAINLLVTETVNVDDLIGDEIPFDNLDQELQSIEQGDLVIKSKIIKVE